MQNTVLVWGQLEDGTEASVASSDESVFKSRLSVSSVAEITLQLLRWQEIMAGIQILSGLMAIRGVYSKELSLQAASSSV